MPHAVYVGSHVLALYNADGSIWGVFDLRKEEANFYADAPELIPIAHIDGNFHGGPVLRIKGESEHWYQVIVNEDTGMTAYALKVPFEPQQTGMWTKTTFEFWLINTRFIQRRPGSSPLLDAPNGKPVAGDDGQSRTLEFIKLDRPGGEWAFVRVNYKLAGWVRLRDGRKFFLWTQFSLGLWDNDKDR
ncbi:MAG: hypothetical protein LC113_10650 [Acidobacteria bacterium]|nr:hypothetical protein [Acidobacteriota bacterium]